MDPLPGTSPPAEEAAGAGGCNEPSSERVPKLRRDVLASRLALHDADLRDSSSSLSSPASPSLSSVVGGTREEATTVAPAASPARMPLSVLARAEAALQRPVQLTRGGLCAEFGADDIECITDGDVLRCLSGDSGGPPDALVEPGGEPAVQMEAHMAALQREIHTFITAVDNDGRRYAIRLGSTGRVQVPLDDGDEDSDDGGSSDDTSDGSSDAGSSTTTGAVPSSEGGAATSGQAATSSPASEAAAPTAPLHKSAPARRPRAAAPVRPGGVPTAVHNARARLQAGRPSAPPPPPPSRPSRRSRAAAAGPPTIAVRPQASLTAVEAARVERLLDSAVMASLAANPYALGAETAQRLHDLAAEARRYADVRGAADDVETHAIVHDVAGDVGGVPGSAEASTVASHHLDTTAAEVGNAYMRDAQQQAAMARQLRSVNARLRAVQRRVEELALAPAEDAPTSVVALRPSWARAAAPSVEEADVQRLLELARAEEVRGREAKLPPTTLPAPTEPFTELRRLLGDACARATARLADFESAPPAVRPTTTFSAVDAEDV
ncbi:hypothetical protein NESM_000595800 [Novymonas esmeraldas]|uniref:Uncharacterized protein n=1 Tax=Novymonas esmeraldas TaxID=1808958 RepID=A0AAW0ESH5_9TRYP